MNLASLTLRNSVYLFYLYLDTHKYDFRSGGSRSTLTSPPSTRVLSPKTIFLDILRESTCRGEVSKVFSLITQLLRLITLGNKKIFFFCRFDDVKMFREGFSPNTYTWLVFPNICFNSFNSDGRDRVEITILTIFNVFSLPWTKLYPLWSGRIGVVGSNEVFWPLLC